ncbi:MAG: transcription-repair coupling factor [Sphingobacteriia bacterium]|jgi:transcription-repair coupling factor (superfamily II helicase)
MFLSHYLQYPGLSAFAQQLGPGRHALTGLVGSQLACAVAALFSQLGRHGIVLVQDREEANLVLNDLEVLLPGQQVVLLPASSKRPYELSTLDNANVLQRGETLNLISRAQPGSLLVVSYPEALFEKVVTRNTLITHTLDVHRGEETGMDLIIEVLEEYGYQPVSFVTEAGQYATRGGIIDVYSFSHDLPFRIEFMGDAIESIREFAPGSQLSTRSMEQLSIIPDFRTLVQEQRISLPEYLSPDTVWYVKDPDYAVADLMKFEEKARKQWKQLTEGRDTVHTEPAQLYYAGPALEKDLRAFCLVDIGFAARPGDAGSDLSFRSQVQPLFKKKFELLVAHMAQRQAAGWQTYIYCDSEAQHRRIREILHQLDASLHYEPVRAALSGGFEDEVLKLACYTDHQIFERYHRFKKRNQAQESGHMTLRELMQLSPGDFITHINHGIGRFGGLTTVEVGKHKQEAVKIFYQDDDVIYVNINALYKIAKYSGKEGNAPRLSKLGSAEWSRTKAKVKRKVKELAFSLVELYAKRKASNGTAYAPDTYLQQELEASFLYEDTPDQERATREVKEDLESPTPMDRLVCGDVGFGKTEIAVRAAFKVATEGKQVALLVPTTILALQHYNTFQDRMADFPLTIDFINRFRSPGEQKDILKRLAEGKIDILVGTHKLLGKEVKFRDLGLLIIDEEHKFGVGHKERLRHLRETIDTLTLTATPIPRTLQFSLLGIRDLSIITTPPPNRQPVETVVSGFSKELIRDALAHELKRGGQAFFVHNRVRELEEYAALIKELLPDARIATAHGQMDGDEMENTLLRFVNREFDVLVSTTIIESGLDIPNANTIIINHAHMYGLSDLHQMRGRVGRSNRKAFAYLLCPPLAGLPNDARKRMEAIQQFSELGAGLQIAMRDLDIRGAGDILGREQSGFIADVGYDVYHKILDESIRELKAQRGLDDEATGADTSETVVETDQPVMLPPEYVPQVAERLYYYRQLSEATDEAALQTLARELIDRFGPMPAPALNLLDTVRARWVGEQLRMAKVVLKGGSLSLTLAPGPDDLYYQSEAFHHILSYVQQHADTARLKQKNDKLVLQIKAVETVKDLYFALKHLLPEPATA